MRSRRLVAAPHADPRLGGGRRVVGHDSLAHDLTLALPCLAFVSRMPCGRRCRESHGTTLPYRLLTTRSTAFVPFWLLLFGSGCRPWHDMSSVCFALTKRLQAPPHHRGVPSLRSRSAEPAGQNASVTRQALASRQQFVAGLKSVESCAGGPLALSLPTGDSVPLASCSAALMLHPHLPGASTHGPLTTLLGPRAHLSRASSVRATDLLRGLLASAGAWHLILESCLFRSFAAHGPPFNGRNLQRLKAGLTQCPDPSGHRHSPPAGSLPVQESMSQSTRHAS